MYAITDDIEPWGLDAMQQQIDSEHKASDKWHAQHSTQHGTECCADTSDDKLPPMTRADGWTMAAVYALCGVAVFSLLWVVLA